jgi:hypothetical protein
MSNTQRCIKPDQIPKDDEWEKSQDVKPKLDILANHLQAYKFRANGFDISVRSTHSHVPDKASISWNQILLLTSRWTQRQAVATPLTKKSWWLTTKERSTITTVMQPPSATWIGLNSQIRSGATTEHRWSAYPCPLRGVTYRFGSSMSGTPSRRLRSQ